ncbi:alcohol dehydrogenase GroES-like domain-containing protein [Stemphylium lycopersici]|uniref:Alcohol dehydrogenase GroES-like domain-containing protein n=1 Tax=Stemphylium lycopersici TaxID=183478 RepID=A0A364MYJ6_STELY|nr:hypothetical protein TW65_03902 [Stemphylium lycopersici]RAR05242.1 alcohol dehydrogenase GroES-like domain-containing protein [Stemphylium lycopersici]RAR07185.1 alcohol dehydrogenase GroES-like domain-containing protein [Stemphylium lycopersici]
MSLPTTHTALKVTGPATLAVTKDAPLPHLDASEILVKVTHIAINPVDAKSVVMSPTPGATSGTDFAGTVALVGSDVDVGDNWHVGDRVMGGVFGNNPIRADNGAFAEYVAIPARLLWRIPDSMDFPTAAALPTALATVGLTLFGYMGITMPDPNALLSRLEPASEGEKVEETTKPKPSYVLVYGGGTASGAMAIQVLSLLGLTPITTCSPASAARCLSLGAIATFDYASANAGTEILEYTSGRLALALDCISSTTSMETCYKAIGPPGGRYVALDPFPLRGHTRRSISPDWICAYTQFGHGIKWAPPFDLDARGEDRECAERWYPLAQVMLDRGLLVAQRVEMREGGLEDVQGAMDMVRKGVVGGKKLVFCV